MPYTQLHALIRPPVRYIIIYDRAYIIMRTNALQEHVKYYIGTYTQKKGCSRPRAMKYYDGRIRYDNGL